jgi:heme oxygenase (mycobilin-producing)
MAVITSILDLKVLPEHIADANETIERVLVATRAFPGSMGVEVLVDVADESHFALVEKWQSLEHDDAYRAWRATPGGASALNGIIESRKLTRFTQS